MISSLVKEPIDDLEDLLIDHVNGAPVLKVVRYDQLKGFSQNQISLFCLKYGFYQIITQELVDFISPLIANKKAIEIGAGNGALGRALNIPLTDSYFQNTPEAMAMYMALQQPTVKYPSDVNKLTAMEAIEKFKPEVVIGC